VVGRFFTEDVMNRLIALLASCTLAWLAVQAAPAHAQEWTDTRVGNFDFLCETTTGVLVSGHQRFSLAARACATAAKANPTLAYQVRPATYKIALVASPAPNSPPPAPVTALAFDPTCAAVPTLQTTTGTAFVSQPLASCYTGSEAATAKFDLLDVTGGPPPHGWAIDSNSGVISNSGAGPQANGSVLIRRTAASGVTLAFPLTWSVQ
jgi:hypothetical protein